VKAVVALDLDQTMIYSERSAGRPVEVSDVWVEDYDGKPLSFMTGPAHAGLLRLSLEHWVVPVTTRTPEQLGRVRLPVPAAWALSANGGVLLVDGQRDAAWDAKVRADLAGMLPAAAVFAWLRPVAGAGWVSSVRQVEDLFVYLVATSRSAIPAEWLEGIRARAAEHGWAVSAQGRKIYLVPDRLLCKGAAARAVAERLDAPLLAAGDSLLDAALLLAADVAIRPAHGELHHAGDLEGVSVTLMSGPESAEEIVRYLHAQADALVAAVRS